MAEHDVPVAAHHETRVIQYTRTPEEDAHHAMQLFERYIGQQFGLGSSSEEEEEAQTGLRGVIQKFKQGKNSLAETVLDKGALMLGLSIVMGDPVGTMNNPIYRYIFGVAAGHYLHRASKGDMNQQQMAMMAMNMAFQMGVTGYGMKLNFDLAQKQQYAGWGLDVAKMFGAAMGNNQMFMGMMQGQQGTPFVPMQMPGIPMGYQYGYQQMLPDGSMTRRPDRKAFAKKLQALMNHVYAEGQRNPTAAVAAGTYLPADGERQGATGQAPVQAIRDTPGASSSSAPSNVPLPQALAGVGPAGTLPVTSYSMSHADLVAKDICTHPTMLQRLPLNRMPD